MIHCARASYLKLGRTTCPLYARVPKLPNGREILDAVNAVLLHIVLDEQKVIQVLPSIAGNVNRR